MKRITPATEEDKAIDIQKLWERLSRDDAQVTTMRRRVVKGLIRRLVEAESGFGPLPTCRVCGCTESDCTLCVERTGDPCTWVEEDLCSACAPGDAAAVKAFKKWKKEWDLMTAE